MNYGGERTNVAEEEKNTREQANSDPGKSVLFRVGLKSKCGKSSKCKQMPYKNGSNCTRGPKF